MLGTVYLIGAGPGDDGLLTLKADKIIKQADVFVYDRLVSQKIMERLPKDAELINVGKTVGNHPTPQSRINEILLEQAKLGKTVVRLKGGDSFVFGRGGEELELLAQHNIPFQVIPGITSSIAVPAYAGIPVTHRDFCSSLHIITGHAKKDGQIKIDYPSLVKLDGTLIFMMSVSTIGDIAKGLIEAGMDRAMPIAVIENGTRPEQRKVVSTLEKIQEIIIEHQIKSPSVIVVGRVCSLSDKFDWYSNLPLKNCSVLITRPNNSMGKLAEKLENLGANPVHYPCIVTKNVEFDTKTEAYDWVMFTSSVGVHSYFEMLGKQGLDARSLYGAKIAVVGKETAQTLKSYGIQADFVPKTFDGEHLAKEILENCKISGGATAVLFRANIATDILPNTLKNAGIAVTEITCYETSYIKNEKIDLSHINYLAFTSASTVDGFVNCFDHTDFSQLTAICIGKQTQKRAKEHGFTTIRAEEATTDSMTEKLLEVYQSGK